jgi:hydroxymethylglutaryl-CoA synthase
VVGLISYGAYIPRWRMNLGLVGARGERSITGPDEDSVTMAVSAVMQCLKGVDRSKVDGLFFASTSSPYTEKQMSTMIAKACDLREDIMTADFGSSTKGGTTALRLAADSVKAGSAKQIIVVASDCRMGEPGSEHERNGGAGAGAVLIGADDVAVSVESSMSVANEIFDVWQRKTDSYINSWETRFDVTFGYTKSINEAVGGLLKKDDMAATDFAKAVFYCPDAKTPIGVAKGLGFDPMKQVQDPMMGTLGSAGAASPLILLVAALEEAAAGDNILLAGYGNGADAMRLKVNKPIDANGRVSVKAQMESKLMLSDYFTYLKWNGLVNLKDAKMPYVLTYASAPPTFRERERLLAFHGTKCTECGAIEFPPQRICAKCGAKDKVESVTLSGKQGKVFTCMFDPLTTQMEGLVNIDGGGRIFCNMSDCTMKTVQIDTTVEMSFRRIALVPWDTMVSYTWKAIPLRENG